MRDWDLEIYSALLKRPGLCMGTNDWNKVEDFIRAYELGSKWECDFMNLLTNQINDKYGIPMPTRGLIEQLKLVAKKTKQNWEELFINETKEILKNESDQNNKFRFRRILREKILNYFEEIPEKIGTAYYMNLNQINRQIDDWHGKNLSDKEIELFKEVREEISKGISVHLTEKFEPSDTIKSAIEELTKLIKKENES